MGSMMLDPNGSSGSLSCSSPSYIKQSFSPVASEAPPVHLRLLWSRICYLVIGMPCEMLQLLDIDFRTLLPDFSLMWFARSSRPSTFHGLTAAYLLSWRPFCRLCRLIHSLPTRKWPRSPSLKEYFQLNFGHGLRTTTHEKCLHRTPWYWGLRLYGLEGVVEQHQKKAAFGPRSFCSRLGSVAKRSFIISRFVLRCSYKQQNKLMD